MLPLVLTGCSCSEPEASVPPAECAAADVQTVTPDVPAGPGDVASLKDNGAVGHDMSTAPSDASPDAPGPLRAKEISGYKSHLLSSLAHRDQLYLGNLVLLSDGRAIGLGPHSDVEVLGAEGLHDLTLATLDRESGAIAFEHLGVANSVVDTHETTPAVGRTVAMYYFRGVAVEEPGETVVHDSFLLIRPAADGNHVQREFHGLAGDGVDDHILEWSAGVCAFRRGENSWCVDRDLTGEPWSLGPSPSVIEDVGASWSLVHTYRIGPEWESGWAAYDGGELRSLGELEGIGLPGEPPLRPRPEGYLRDSIHAAWIPGVSSYVFITGPGDLQMVDRYGNVSSIGASWKRPWEGLRRLTGYFVAPAPRPTDGPSLLSLIGLDGVVTPLDTDGFDLADAESSLAILFRSASSAESHSLASLLDVSTDPPTIHWSVASLNGLRWVSGGASANWGVFAAVKGGSAFLLQYRPDTSTLFGHTYSILTGGPAGMEEVATSLARATLVQNVPAPPGSVLVHDWRGLFEFDGVRRELRGPILPATAQLFDVQGHCSTWIHDTACTDWECERPSVMLCSPSAEGDD